MTGSEFSNQFDVLYNNITSNQAPGLNEYEKSVFLTKAQDELVKNYFLPQSNAKQAGYDGSAKRQMDFSMLMKSVGGKEITPPANNVVNATTDDYIEDVTHSRSYDPRAALYAIPLDLFIPINESLRFIVRTSGSGAGTYNYTTAFQRQVIPLSFEEYTRLMNKPYKEPLKGQAWRLLTNNTEYAEDGYRDTDSQIIKGKMAEIILGHNDIKWLKAAESGKPRILQYLIRYIRRPKPILVAPIDSYGLSIAGHDGYYTDSEDYDTAYKFNDDGTEILNPCELDESLHEEILQRAVELAKIAWTATGQENVQLVMQAGQRSE